MKKSNKKIIKILIALALMLMLVLCGTTTFANTYHVDNIEPTSVPFAGIVITVVQFCCYTAAVIWIMIMGIRYMSAAPDGKAEVKKQMMAAFIGGCILFGVGTIIRIVADIATQL